MDYKKKNSLYFSPVLSSPIPSTLGIFCMEKTEVRVNFCGNERWKENRQREEKGNFQSRILNLKALKKMDALFCRFMYMIMQWNIINVGARSQFLFSPLCMLHTLFYILPICKQFQIG